MYQIRLQAGRRPERLRHRHPRWARLRAVTAAFLAALGLLGFSQVTDPADGPLGSFGQRIALADTGHPTNSRATQTPTPTPAATEAEEHTGMPGARDQSEEAVPEPTPVKVDESEHDDALQDVTDEGHDQESTGSEEADTEEDTSDGSSRGTTDDHADTRSDESNAGSPGADEHEATSDMGEGTGADEQESTATDEHDDAVVDEHEDAVVDDHGSEEEGSQGHEEIAGPSELVRNITLGGFAGINASVLVAAAILKKRSPQKKRGRAASRETTGGPRIRLTVEPGPLGNRAVPAHFGFEASRSTVPLAIPVDDSIIAEATAHKGDDLG